jgi:hypothetical protein
MLRCNELQEANSTRMEGDEHVRGNGLVTTDQGRQIPVQYELYLCRTVANAKSGRMSSPRSVHGLVWAPHDPSFVFVYFGQSMTLEMEDGRYLRFFHQDIDGNIVLNEWIG